MGAGQDILKQFSPDGLLQVFSDFSPKHRVVSPDDRGGSLDGFFELGEDRSSADPIRLVEEGEVGQEIRPSNAGRRELCGRVEDVLGED